MEAVLSVFDEGVDVVFSLTVAVFVVVLAEEFSTTAEGAVTEESVVVEGFTATIEEVVGPETELLVAEVVASVPVVEEVVVGVVEEVVVGAVTEVVETGTSPLNSTLT